MAWRYCLRPSSFPARIIDPFMGTVLIEQGEVRNANPGGQATEPMRWAVLKSSGIPVYVGGLDSSQNGNACGCRCPTCGEDLQAVNAGKDPSHFLQPNSLGMFFRHPSGRQRKDCGFLAAKLAALHLLMSRDEIDLPAPRRTARVVGVSGSIYSAVAHGQGFRARIVDRQWIDEQTGRITIEGGRTVLVSLRSTTSVSDAGIHGVLTIRVDDQEVSSWSPERILESLKLDGDFACWDKHWDDGSLLAEATRQAQSEAYEALDGLPGSDAAFDALTDIQKSETILHATVKDILERAAIFRAPAICETITLTMPDGRLRAVDAKFEAEYLTLSDVRLEQSLPGMVPDVLCIARSDRQQGRQFPLLIEVAVTHRVDAAKRAKILQRGVACIEIDLRRMGFQNKRISVSELKSQVIHTEHGKEWVHNPAFAAITAAFRSDLEAEAESMRRGMAHEEERQQWLSGRSIEALLDLLMNSLRHYWRTRSAMMTYEDYAVHPKEVIAQLAKRGVDAPIEPGRLLSPDGLLGCLDDLYTAHEHGRTTEALSGLWRLYDDKLLRRYVTLGILVAKAYPLELPDSDVRRLKELRDKVTASLDQEELEFARPRIYDNLVGLLFSALRDSLANPRGTIDDVESKRRTRQAQEQQERARIANEAHLRAAVEWDRMAKIDVVLRTACRDGWLVADSDQSLDSVLKTIRVVRLIGNYARSGIDVKSLVHSAWSARSRGIPPRMWLDEQKAKDPAHAQMLVEVLRASHLIR